MMMTEIKRKLLPRGRERTWWCWWYDCDKLICCVRCVKFCGSEYGMIRAASWRETERRNISLPYHIQRWKHERAYAPGILLVKYNIMSFQGKLFIICGQWRQCGDGDTVTSRNLLAVHTLLHIGLNHLIPGPGYYPLFYISCCIHFLAVPASDSDCHSNKTFFVNWEPVCRKSCFCVYFC